ncbi:TetR/AcrR family transcriptional regulator [Paenibacillus sp. GCM10012303]|jgi:AcrR family transcriptional regulator|uniref:TetR/AcrR family transcriptional regulator n=1 Tax=Paenibacillus sp. GCM10012303 TaxID=3317340 RepID=UPI00361DB31B
MNKQTKRSNRDIVLQTATVLFLEKGYQVTSMDEIVTASKVSKTNIYYHFKSKEELLAAIVRQMTGTYNQIIEEIAGQTELTVTERIGRFAEVLSEQQPYSLGGCPFLTIYVQTSHESDFVREEIARFFQNQIFTLEKLLQEGIHRQEFKPGLPVSRIAELIVSTIEGGLFLQHTHRDSAFLPNLLQTLAYMLK